MVIFFYFRNFSALGFLRSILSQLWLCLNFLKFSAAFIFYRALPGGLLIHSLKETAQPSANRRQGKKLTMAHIYVALTRCQSLQTLYLNEICTLEELQRFKWHPELKAAVNRVRQMAQEVQRELLQSRTFAN